FRQQRFQLGILFFTRLVRRFEVVQVLLDDLRLGIALTQPCDLLVHAFGLGASSAREEVIERAVNSTGNHEKYDQPQVPGKSWELAEFHLFILYVGVSGCSTSSSRPGSQAEAFVIAAATFRLQSLPSP